MPNKCIYCGLENCLYSKEHVIPQCLGTFDTNNPTIKGYVCKNCNSDIFSKLETNFKENSIEGLFLQQFGFTDSVRIKGNNINIDLISGLGNSFFDDIFYYLKVENGKMEAIFEPQVKINGYSQSGYIVYPIKYLQQCLNNIRKKEKIIKLIKSVKEKNIAIFLGNSENNDNVISMLEKEYGIKYNKSKEIFFSLEHINGIKGKFKGEIDSYIQRFIIKICFNYFAYNCIREGYGKVLYESNFNYIKQFILGKRKDPRAIFTIKNNKSILYEEGASNQVFLAHKIKLYEENHRVKVSLDVFGQNIYEVILGIIPTIFDNNKEIYRWGVGHIFDPFNKSIVNIYNNQKKETPLDVSGIKFGLYNRFI